MDTVRGIIARAMRKGWPARVRAASAGSRASLERATGSASQGDVIDLAVELLADRVGRDRAAKRGRKKKARAA